MKKYIILSHAVLVGIIAFLVYANYLKTPAVERVERTVSIAEEIKMVDSIAALYKGVVFEHIKDIPNCCTEDFNGIDEDRWQTVIRHKNGMTKFALSWRFVKDSGFKLGDDDILYFGEDGHPVAYRFEGRWICSKQVKHENSSYEHLVENPEACLNIK